MPPEEAIAEPTEQEMITEATNKAFEKIDPPEPKVEKPAEEPKPEPQPEDKVGDDKANGKGELTEEDKKILADVKEGRIIPKYRLDKVLERVESYESFGTLEELEKKLADKAKESAPAVKEEPKIELSDEEKELADHVRKVLPEIKTVAELNQLKQDIAELKAERAAEKKRIAQAEAEVAKANQAELDKLADKAESRVKVLAQEAGLDISDESNLLVVINAVADIISGNKEWKESYWNKKDAGVIDKAFEAYKKIYSGFQRKASAEILRDKRKQERLPKPPAPGGTPEKEQPEDTSKMTFDQVGERAFSRLSGR